MTDDRGPDNEQEEEEDISWMFCIDRSPVKGKVKDEWRVVSTKERRFETLLK